MAAKRKASKLGDPKEQISALLEYQLLKPYRIPLDQIRPAPVNPNHLSAAELEATAASMLRYGIIKAGMVRPYDDSDRDGVVATGLHLWLLFEFLAGKVTDRLPPTRHDLDTAQKALWALFESHWKSRYEMIDAHHRLEIMQRWIANGFPEGSTPHPSVVECVRDRVLPCSIHPCSAAVGKHMRLILTYDRGTPQELPAGQLAAELLRSMPMTELLTGLPWTEAIAQQYVEVAEFDWLTHLERIGDEKAKRDADKAKRRAEQFKITIVGPNNLRESAMQMIADFAAANPAVKVKQ